MTGLSVNKLQVEEDSTTLIDYLKSHVRLLVSRIHLVSAVQ